LEFAAVVLPHLDAAYDKILSKVNIPNFSLALLPPYEGSTEKAYAAYRQALVSTYPRWIDSEALPAAAS